MVALWAPRPDSASGSRSRRTPADALAELGVIPKEAAADDLGKGRERQFRRRRIDEIERETKHDVIAFLTHLAEFVGPDARFVHQGMTSSDVLDTCLRCSLPRAADILIEDVDNLLAALKRRAFEHKMTPTIGRCHGIHAEPATFGLKLAEALCRVRPCARTAGRGAGGNRHLRHFRRGRHIRQYRPARRRACRRENGPQAVSRSRPRSFRATATPCSSPLWAWSPRPSSGWR